MPHNMAIASSPNPQMPENLIADLSDEELAAVTGGCNIQITTKKREITVIVAELPQLDKDFVNVDNGAVSVVYDPNGSIRYQSWKRNL
ncbi:hypothetical protein ACQFX9_19820 [Aliinostoc sp. HNIBRCY26]|uniref:hypothetical protein n=1 Tax=Aliinostoc sp. HNIBRCY26 TaxID=3418997 RepID=UPI003D052502